MVNPFTDYIGNTGVNISSTAGGIVDMVMKTIIAIIIIGGIIGFIAWKKHQKNYNIPVTIWIPRSDNKITDEISAIGGYFRVRNQDGGSITVFRLKRKGISSIEIPPPSSNFLVGLKKKLYLIQKGVDDFEPVDPTGFRYVTTKKGRRIPITELVCVNQAATAWLEDNRESAKKRFTFHGMWAKYKDFIQITIFIMLVLIFVYVNYQGLADIAEKIATIKTCSSGVSVG